MIHEKLYLVSLRHRLLTSSWLLAALFFLFFIVGSNKSLACDGLWDVIRDQEAVNFVLDRIGERELVAKYLVEEALKRGSADNITVSVAFLT